MTVAGLLFDIDALGVVRYWHVSSPAPHQNPPRRVARSSISPYQIRATNFTPIGDILIDPRHLLKSFRDSID